MKRHVVVLAAVLFGLGQSALLHAQGFGGAGLFEDSGSSNKGFRGVWRPERDLPSLDRGTALDVITIDGTAEIRVEPERIRLVLAVTTEAALATTCQTENATKVKAVVDAWKELGVDDDDIVTDFINILPVFGWSPAERDGQRVLVQEQDGYRMQTNLHIAVATEEAAMAAINAAFKHDVTEIVTFDYWSSQLDKRKEEARAAATKAAKRKSDTLLAVFDDRPALFNIQERTAVFFPRALYRTFENILEERVTQPSRRDVPRIYAYRPKMTFFEGLQTRSDIRSTELSMRPKIAVVSTVRLYYSPPTNRRVKRAAD